MVKRLCYGILEDTPKIQQSPLSRIVDARRMSCKDIIPVRMFYADSKMGVHNAIETHEEFQASQCVTIREQGRQVIL